MLMFHQIVQKKRSLKDTFSDRFIFGGREMISEDATIKSAATFHDVLAKERARVDRNSHVFSLVSFEVGPLDYGTDTTKYFIDQLKKQIRITDEIGWLDSYTVGVLLFNSLSAEASKFIEKIQRIYPHKKFFKYSISCYPEDKTDHSDNEETDEFCHHSIPVSTSLHGHHSATDDEHALSLQPIFFNKTSILKRLCDIVLSILALVVLSPLLLTIAIGVKLTSRGPIFFRQQRAGLGGTPFTFLKFRTMQVDAEEKKSELLQFNERTGPVFKMANDPRITILGMFLRRWSLDELPQFINVLKGDMSLVGPRPPTMDEVEKYESWHNYRLEVLPGITCIWQVYARGEKSFENWVRLDIKYKREQSFLLDLKLIALTVPAVFSRRGAS
jgi:lipopolysaccharide/colanic/teichoic acid biosynthesis glycosyltransferase